MIRLSTREIRFLGISFLVLNITLMMYLWCLNFKCVKKLFDEVGSFYMTSCANQLKRNNNFVDVEDCMDDDSCPSNTTCIDTVGSFNCTCPSGFEYDNVTESCEGEMC